MADFHIHTHLQEILMIDAISRWDDKRILAGRKFNGEPGFCAVEACAQLSALHVRKRTGFACHAFLLALISVSPLPPGKITGTARLDATLEGISRRAFSYKTTIRLNGCGSIRADLIIGTVDYGEEFNQDCLQHRYETLFSVLCRAGSPSD